MQPDCILMDRQTLDKLKTWFSDYSRTFHTPDPADLRNITLKEEHTCRVCDNMTAIARGLSLEEGRVMLAEAVALFHDVGRFPQYRKFRTFQDSVSVNHAALGAKVLIENDVLRDLPEKKRDLVIRAVTLHNVFAIPTGIDPDVLPYLKMIRDADKLDIWRVFIEQADGRAEDRASAANLGLPDTAGYSPAVLAALRRRELVPYSSLRSMNDFRILQLAWIFDLNFAVSLRMAEERRCLDRLAALLPDVREIRAAIGFVREQVSVRLRES